jgi:hypothetical protein
MQKKKLILQVVLSIFIGSITSCDDSSTERDVDGGPICTDEGSPAVPENPVPAADATNVDFVLTRLDWDDAEGATSYDVYFDGFVCPPPAYPDPAFQNVTSSELTDLKLLAEMGYCWQVVSLDDNDCPTQGPTWSFTTACGDPVPGPPEVTSPLSATYPSGTTEGYYPLAFSEEVNKVGQGLTLSPDNEGLGTHDGTNRMSDTEFHVNFTGVADGESYTLTVGTAVRDTCGNTLAAPVDITITIDESP